MDPPLDFESLKELFMQRYPVLRLLIEQPYRPQTINVFWQDECIENSYELQRIRKLCQLSNHVVHLMISVADCDHDPKPNLREFPNYEGIAPQALLASVDYVFNNQAFHQNMDYSN